MTESAAYNVDDEAPKAATGLGRETGENVTVWLLKQLERHSQMMILQHRLVVVDQRQLRVYTQPSLHVHHAIDVMNVFLTFFIRVTFFTFLTLFLIFHVFYLKKTFSNAKYKYVKIQRKIFLEDDLAMIFIDFGLFRSLYCKISYLSLLAEEY